MAVELRTTEVLLPLSSALRDELDRFVTSQDCVHYRQLPAWIDVEDAKHPRLFVSRTTDDRIVASSIICEMRGRLPFVKTAEIARGPVAGSIEVIAAQLIDIVELVRDEYSSLRANPFIPGEHSNALERAIEPAGFRRTDLDRYYAHTVLVEICPTEAEQWRRLRRSTRTAINKSRRAGLTVRQEMDSAAYGNFAKRFSQFARGRGLDGISTAAAQRIHAVFANLELPAVYLLSAMRDGGILGQILLVRNGNSLIYEWGWTTQDKKDHNQPITHDLVWHAFNLGRETGCSTLDLGGYWGDRPPTDPSNQFKLGFGKNVIDYSGTYEYICSPLANLIQSWINRTVALQKKWRT